MFEKGINIQGIKKIAGNIAEFRNYVFFPNQSVVQG